MAIDYFRKNAVRSAHSFTAFDWETEQLVSPTKSPESFIELNDETRQILEALEKCTGDQQMVIIMRYFQELSIAETAAILNWTEGKVKTTQHRAIKQLRELLSRNKEANKMNHEHWDEDRIEELLKNVPKIHDVRSKEEVF